MKQYHEERDGGNKVKKTEYSLGTYSKEQFYADKEALKLVLSLQLVTTG